MASDIPQDHKDSNTHCDNGASIPVPNNPARSAEDAAFVIHTANIVLPQQLRAGIKQCMQKDAAFDAWKHFYVSGDKEQLRRDVAEITVFPTIGSALVGVAVASNPIAPDEPKKGVRGFFQKVAAWNDNVGMTMFMTAYGRTSKNDRPEGLSANQYELYALFVGGRKYWADPSANPSPTLRDALQRAAARTMLKSLADLLEGSGALLAPNACDWNKVTREIMYPAAWQSQAQTHTQSQTKPQRKRR